MTNLDPLDVQDVFSDPECAEIIALAERLFFNDGVLLRGIKDDNARRARVTWLADDAETAWIGERLIETVIGANRRHFSFDLTDFSERSQVAWYGAADGGFFDWHADVGDGSVAARRKLTLVVQLSPDASYDGGELEVNANGHHRRARRTAGCGVLFPSFVLHRVAPVTRGARYSLTTWIHGPPFR